MDLIVLGVDGVDPEYLEKTIEERDVPGWERLKRESFYTELQSTVPAVTIPAWISMFSGHDPGRLDAYHLSQSDFENWELDFPDSSKFQGKFFWDQIDREVALHYVPGTTPVYPVNGVMRGGFPSPEDFEFYPEEFEQNFGKLEKNQSHSFTTASSKIDAEYENFETERMIADRMLEEDTDVFVSVIRMTDQSSHFAEKESQVIDCYEKVDDEIRKYVEKAEEEDANLVIVSDHGFFNARKKFNVAAFLEEQGLLETVEGGKESMLYRIAEPLLDTPLKKYLKYAHDYYRSLTGKKLSGRGDDILQSIEKSSRVLPMHFGLGKDCVLKVHTHDMPHGSVDPGEAEEIVEELKEELRGLERNGRKVVEKVWRGEELYSGEKVPEIAFRTTDDFVVETAPASKMFSKTNTFTHRENGVFFAKGPEIKEDADQELRIFDVAPLIYALLGEKIPRDLEGELPEELLEDVKPEYRSVEAEIDV